MPGNLPGKDSISRTPTDIRARTASVSGVLNTGRKKYPQKKPETENARNLKILMKGPIFVCIPPPRTHNKAREFKDEQKILDNHVWELMNPEKSITETK